MLEQFISQEVLDSVYLGNSVAEYIYAVAIFIALMIVFGIFQFFLLKYLQHFAKKTKTDIDDTGIEIVKSVKPPFYSFLAFYFGLQFLFIPGWLEKALYIALLVWLIYQVILAAQILLDFIFAKTISKNEDQRTTRAALGTLRNVLKGVLWVVGLLVLLQNIGIDVTALIAGLGIGGIAIALALQNVLGDLFSSLAIQIDKPFIPGDFIVVGEHKGVVEKIGIKTTRIRALQGEEIVISNQELTSSRIQNFKRMEKRRIVFQFGVTYDTKQELMKEIPDIVRSIIDPIDGTDFDRTHFINFGDSSLDFEVVYYVESGDYNDYVNNHQNILLALKEAFEKKKIEMAFPTRTVHVMK